MIQPRLHPSFLGNNSCANSDLPGAISPPPAFSWLWHVRMTFSSTDKSFNGLYQCVWKKIQSLHTAHTVWLLWPLHFFPTSSCAIPNPSLSVLRHILFLEVPWPSFIPSCHRRLLFSWYGMFFPPSRPSPHPLLLVLQISAQVPLWQERLQWALLPNPTSTPTSLDRLLCGILSKNWVLPVITINSWDWLINHSVSFVRAGTGLILLISVPAAATSVPPARRVLGAAWRNGEVNEWMNTNSDTSHLLFMLLKAFTGL